MSDINKMFHKAMLEITKLKAENKKLREALSFYADTSNWSYQQIIDDVSDVNGSLEGGAKAREYFEKYGEIDE